MSQSLEIRQNENQVYLNCKCVEYSGRVNVQSEEDPESDIFPLQTICICIGLPIGQLGRQWTRQQANLEQIDQQKGKW